MILAVERLDHADALQILVHHIVKLVIRVEHALEDRVHDDDQADQAHCQHRYACHKTMEICGEMRNEKIHAATSMIGARMPMRMIIWYEFCTFVTSVVAW